MTIISCIYNCKFQKDGVCNLSSDSKIASENNYIACPYFIEKGSADAMGEKLQKRPPLQFLRQ